MSQLGVPRKSDQIYTAYFSVFKIALKAIDSSMTKAVIDDYIRDVENIPKWWYKNAKVMAIARYMAGSGPTFDRMKAMNYIDVVFKSDKLEKGKSELIIDVAKYYVRLTQQL